jgi:hypothetical protein
MATFDLCVRLAQVFATLVAAGVAIWVGYSWHRTLRNKSIDECLTAMYDAVDLIDRCFSIPAEPKGNRWRSYDEAWNSWRKANGLWEVVRRYHCDLPRHHLSRLADVLLSVKPLLEDGLGNDDAKVQAVRNAAKSFKTDAENKLPKPRGILW